MNPIVISIIESIYIIYMFNFFKTSVYLSHPFDVFTKNIKLIDHSDRENHMCSLGNITGYVLGIWFIIRHYINPSFYQKWNQIIIYIVFFGCLISNTNAFVYFLPIFIIENLNHGSIKNTKKYAES